MVRYSLFVLKVPLNHKQTNKQYATRHIRAYPRFFIGGKTEGREWGGILGEGQQLPTG